MDRDGRDQGTTNLEKIDHIVVLMLENRSFDHLLGYLSLSGKRPDVDGLTAGLANEHAGSSYPIHHLETTVVDFDPDHSASGIDRQIAGGTMGGFVSSAAGTLAARALEECDPAVVMGYYDGADVPVYDHLAEQFALCERWFSSVAGSTMPNRLYALCGRAAGSRDNRPPYLPPLYHQPSFVRHLDTHGVSWRWYSFDPGSLRLADVHYRLGHHDRFGYFSKTGLPWRTVFDPTVNQGLPSFLDDAANGMLPEVSWIDPAFTNFNPLGFPVNDDHPPADVSDGQDLALAVYDALASSPHWERSLLIIVYDEHGGFFDHVAPPAAADDDPRTFGGYGVRVPAIVVSPWVEARSVCRTVFDHTSLIKTILTRFCPQALPDSSSSAPRNHTAGLGPQHLGRRVRGVEPHRRAPEPPRPAPASGSRRAGASSRRPRPRHWHCPDRGRPGGRWERRSPARRPAAEHPSRHGRAEKARTPGERAVGVVGTSPGFGEPGTLPARYGDWVSRTDEKGIGVMSDSDSGLHLAEERLQIAEEKLEKVQSVLDEIRRVVVVAERAEAAAEHARADLRKVNLVVLGSAAVLAVVVVLSRRGN